MHDTFENVLLFEQSASDPSEKYFTLHVQYVLQPSTALLLLQNVCSTRLVHLFSLLK